MYVINYHTQEIVPRIIRHMTSHVRVAFFYVQCTRSKGKNEEGGRKCVAKPSERGRVREKEVRGMGVKKDEGVGGEGGWESLGLSGVGQGHWSWRKDSGSRSMRYLFCLRNMMGTPGTLRSLRFRFCGTTETALWVAAGQKRRNLTANSKKKHHEPS